MTTIDELLAEYARTAPDTRAKGFYFERLVRQSLATDPAYSAQYDEIWLWQDWPDRNGQVDTGIDLVALGLEHGNPRHILDLIGSIVTVTRPSPLREEPIIAGRASTGSISEMVDLGRLDQRTSWRGSRQAR